VLSSHCRLVGNRRICNVLQESHCALPGFTTGRYAGRGTGPVSHLIVEPRKLGWVALLPLKFNTAGERVAQAILRTRELNNNAARCTRGA
jgi:hypothetical protein